MPFIRLSLHRFLDRLCKDQTSVCLFNVHAAKCKPCYKYMFDCCLVSSLSPMVFYNILLPMFSAGRSPASLLLVCVPPRPTAAWLLLRSVVPYHSLFLLLLLRPGRQVRLLFLSTSLLSLGYPSPTPPSLFLTGYFNAQISGFRYPSPAPPRLFLTGYFDAQVSAFRYPSPAPPRLLLTGYLDAQVSGFWCPSPAPPRLFLAGYLDAQVSVFRCPSPAPPRLFLTCYFDAQVSLFRYPRAFFSLPVLVSLIVCFDALLFSHPTFPSRLLGWPARSLCRLAVRLRFLPLRGFYRSAVFIAPLSPVFLGALLFRRPHACCPPVFTHFRAARSLCRLAVGLRFLPLRGFYRSAVFTALRFLPLCGFYRSAFFTALRFLPLCGFYRSAVFTALRFLPLCGFYRSAVFTALRFLPLCGFYRSAFAVSLGALLFRRPPACCPPVFVLFRAHPVVPARPQRLRWAAILDPLFVPPARSVTAHLTGFPFVHFIQIRGPSVVSSFGCRDTGTACTSTSLWNLTAHGNKAFSPQTDGSAVCRYAY